MIAFEVSAASTAPTLGRHADLLGTSSLASALSDHLRFDLQASLDGHPPEHFIAVLAIESYQRPGASAASVGGVRLCGYGQVSGANDADLMEIVVDGAGVSGDTESAGGAESTPPRLGVDLFNTTVDAQRTFHSGTHLRWWTDLDHGPIVDAAARSGFALERRLFQMAVDLSSVVEPDAGNAAEGRVSSATRAFDPDTDVERLLAVNNAAFAGHGEQGGWTMSQLRQRLAEPWFEPEGLRIIDVDGTMAGFCWTKPHGADLGEIYVIAVDPEFGGLGLGTRLVLDGLAAIGRSGRLRAMLWVDGDNHRAIRLYERLGFSKLGTRSAYLASGTR